MHTSHFMRWTITKTCTWGQGLVKAAFLTASSKALLGETDIFLNVCVTVEDHKDYCSSLVPLP